MKVTAIDFESFYDSKQGYTLRKLTPVEYVLDPRFEAIGMAVREGHPSNNPTYWVDGPDLQRWFDQADRQSMYVSHNWLFDGCIAAWRYGFVPRVMVDTMGVSRSVLGHVLKSHSLASVAEYLGLQAKGTTVHKVDGMNLAAIKFAGLYDEYKVYSCDDADRCMEIFDRLVRSGRYPASEIALMDMVLRAAIQPRFRLDLSVLAEHKNNIRVAKDTLLARVGLQRGPDGKCSELMSNEKFADCLRNLGVDPPTKVSPVTGQVTYAFSRQDPEFIDLQEHESPDVQALIAARLGHKSTLEETRTERFIKISQLHWGNYGGQVRLLPVPLRVGGAHTHRLSGEWKLNLQNLPTRGDNNALRRALIAGPGETVVTVDASQIEARIVAWLCGQQDLISDFAAGVDIYSSFASEVFGYKVERKRKDGDHAAHGFVGKTGVLGLGFNVGWEKFQRTVKLDSKKFTGKEILLSDEQSLNVVSTYRRKYACISGTWPRLQKLGIPVLAGNPGTFSIGPCTFEHGAVNLPSGLQLKYHNLRHDGQNWLYDYGRETKKLYGGKLLENLVQALARIVTMDAAVRIQKRIKPMGLWLNLQAHDELVYVVPDELVDTLKVILTEEMTRRPAWAPDLPLACEVGTGPSYGEAK